MEYARVDLSGGCVIKTKACFHGETMLLSVWSRRRYLAQGGGRARMESIDYDLVTERGHWQQNRIPSIFTLRAKLVGI